MATNIDDIMKDTTAEDVDTITEFPKCTIEWCTSNLPATRYIPIRPDSPNIRHIVCENCYYDYESEGIYTYSYTDRQLYLRNMSPEERFNLRRKLYRLDPDWRE